jgi:hypothetical protein
VESQDRLIICPCCKKEFCVDSDGLWLCPFCEGAVEVNQENIIDHFKKLREELGKEL